MATPHSAGKKKAIKGISDFENLIHCNIRINFREICFFSLNTLNFLSYKKKNETKRQEIIQKSKQLMIKR